MEAAKLHILPTVKMQGVNSLHLARKKTYSYNFKKCLDHEAWLKLFSSFQATMIDKTFKEK